MRKLVVFLFISLVFCSTAAQANQAFDDFLVKFSATNNITVDAPELDITSLIPAITSGRIYTIVSYNQNGSTFNGGGNFPLFKVSGAGTQLHLININLVNQSTQITGGYGLLVENKAAATFAGSSKTYISGHNYLSETAPVYVNNAYLIAEHELEISNNYVKSDNSAASGVFLTNKAEGYFYDNVVFNNNYTYSEWSSYAAALVLQNASIGYFAKDLTISNSIGGMRAQGAVAIVGDGNDLEVLGTLNITGNTVDRNTAGLFMEGKSKATFNGDAIFSSNTSILRMAAINVSSGAEAYFRGNTVIRNNTVAQYDGSIPSSIIFVHDTSRLVFDKNFELTGNNAKKYTIYNLGNIEFNGAYTLMENNINNHNTAGVAATDSWGGAYSGRNAMSSATFAGFTQIINNTAVGRGGGFYLENSAKILFSSTTQISGNKALYGRGGGFYITNNAVATFKGLTEISNNESLDGGGGFYAQQSTVTFEKASYITNNSGGGAFILSSIVNFEGGLFVSGNQQDGGFYLGNSVVKSKGRSIFEKNTGSALFISASRATEFDGELIVSENTGTDSGGIYLKGSPLSVSKKAIFNNNKGYVGGGLVVMFNSTADFNGGVEFIGNTSVSRGGGMRLSGDSPMFKAIVNITQSDVASPTVFYGNYAGGVSNAFHLAAYSELNFNITAGSVEIFDGFSGTNKDNKITVSGNGSLNFYGDAKGNLADLEINGGSFNVKKGAVLDAGALTIADAAKLDLDNDAIDTISAQFVDWRGNLTMTLTGNENDIIVSASTASIGVNNSLEMKGYGSFSQKRINILNALGGGLAGATISSVLLPAGLSYTVESEDNWIYLLLSGLNPAAFSDLDLTHNQSEVANALDILSLTSTGDIDSIIAQIFNSDDNTKKIMFDDLAADFIANVLHAGASKRIQPYSQKRIEQYCFGETCIGEGSRIWAQAQYGDRTFGKDENSIGDFSNTSYGGNFGYDILMKERFIFGASALYDKDEFTQRGSSGEMESLGLGLYAFKWFDNLELRGLFTAARQNYDLKRKIHFLDRTASSDFDAFAYNLDFEAAISIFESSLFSIKPFAGVSGALLDYDGFNETGAGAANLYVKENRYFRSDGRIGVTLPGHYKKLGWSVEAAYRYIFTGNRGEFDGVFEGTEPNMNIYGAKLGKGQLEAGAGANYALSEKFGVYAQGIASRGEKNTNYLARVGIQYAFCKKAKKSIEAVKTVVEEIISEPPVEAEPIATLILADIDMDAKPHFAFNSYELTSKEKKTIDEFMQYIDGKKYQKIYIEGHTDNMGSLEYNQKLSDNRANSVASYFIKNGVEKERIESKGFGKTKPLATNETKEGRAQNRRCEIKVY